MNIIKTNENDALVIALEGRLDTTTAPQLEKELDDCIDGVTKLVFDLDKLEYVSSAGLRIFLGAQKKMNKQGEMIIKNVCDDIMDVFEITGFSDIMTIE